MEELELRANEAFTPALLDWLHRGLVKRQLASLGKSLQVRAEIDPVDSIRELVWCGRWATIA